MIYGSVCSGIEAATVAWHPLGWRAAFFSEIEAFPCALLKHYYQTVPNHGDMTLFKEWPSATLDVLVGGTPCQSFSVAGLRKGLDDPRGNLTLVYLAVADKYRPRWLVWENVPGVLSDATGAFGAFLGGLGQLGYGFAYRVLDAQYFGVPQRRRRVFVVGHLGDWRRAAAVLFELASLRGDIAPRRQSREGVAPTIAARTRGGGGLGTDFDCDGGLVAFGGNNTSGPIDVATAVNAHGGPAGRMDFESETFTLAIRGRGDSHDLEYRADGTANAILTPNGGRAGIGVGAVAFHNRQDPDVSGDVTHPLGAKDNGLAVAEVAPTLRAMTNQGPGRMADDAAAMMMVRRLTPRECERLQGFHDDYTLIQYRGKPAADGNRYKALGNSMAVPVMRWIGERIAMVEECSRPQEEKGR
jgi:DNA (cytosine-5)-methyltransferase 1